MSTESLTRPAVHVTAKLGDRGPEVMANVYADTPADLATLLTEVDQVLEATLGVSLRQIAACSLTALAGSVDRTYREAAARRQPQPVVAQAAQPDNEEAPAPRPLRVIRPEPMPGRGGRLGCCGSDTCSRFGEGLIPSTSQYAADGDLFCPGTDPAEENGYCRWVHDKDGTRRKPTRAEANAARRTTAGGRR